METAVRSTSIGTPLRYALQERFDRRRHLAIGHQRGFQRVELGLLGQAAVPQQVDDFLKRRVIGQRMNG